MVRKTVTIKNDIVESLEFYQILNQYQSFSDMVSSSLKLLIEKQKKEQYKNAMLKASTDELYLQDMQEVESAFQYVDGEKLL